MALPKYKTSRANTHSRRANWKAKAAQTVTCPNCGIKHRNPAIDGWQGFFYYYQVIRRLHCDLFPRAIGVRHTLLA